MHSCSPRILALKYQLVFYNPTSFWIFLIFPLSFLFLFFGGESKNKPMKRGGCCHADLRFEKCELWGLGRGRMVWVSIILSQHLCVPSISCGSLHRATPRQKWFCNTRHWSLRDINYIYQVSTGCSAESPGHVQWHCWVCHLSVVVSKLLSPGWLQSAAPGLRFFGSLLTPGSGTNLWSGTICSVQPKRVSTFLTVRDDLEKLMGEIKPSATDWNTDSHHLEWCCRKPNYACAPCLAAQQYCQFEVKSSWSIQAQFCHLLLYWIMFPNGSSLL